MNTQQVVAFTILALVAGFAIPVFAIAHNIAPTIRGVMIHIINAGVTVTCALVIYLCN